MPKITTYKVQVPMYGEVEYVSIQYDENFAISMPKVDYEAQLAAQSTTQEAGI